MLTLALPITYELAGAYNAPVVDFGKKLRLLRLAEGVKATTLARRALGPDASAGDVRDFANYISRVERGGVKSPSLTQLTRLSAGLGLSLSVFFSHIEGLSSANTSDKTTPVTTQDKGVPPHGTSRSLRDDAELADLRQALTSAGEILFNAGLGGARKLDTARRPRTPGRRK